MSVGIDEISFYTSNYFLDLRTSGRSSSRSNQKSIIRELARKKCPWQHLMKMWSLWLQMLLNLLIERVGADSISSLLFATETGIDQSKAAGVYVHRLLDLNANCRVVELKQACYSATAAIQMACALVTRQPEKESLGHCF